MSCSTRSMPHAPAGHHLGEDAAEVLGFGCVQTGGGLVEEDHVERSGQDPGQLDQATLPGGDLGHLAVQDVVDPG